ncbi:MAG: hypothetical protein EDS66_13540 [Planctomycetota bacterium]|nr:MAG: hypothetical protein EDS66_13540 [Planctomycetota bacterium]MCQ3921671.1 hypothetical protein [Planctomycetota bacterium]
MSFKDGVAPGFSGEGGEDGSGSGSSGMTGQLLSSADEPATVAHRLRGFEVTCERPSNVYRPL